jgi:hypothetical protein
MYGFDRSMVLIVVVGFKYPRRSNVSNLCKANFEISSREA